MLEQDISAELRAAADSLEAELEAGVPSYRDLLALTAQLRVWGDELAHLSLAGDPPRPPATIRVH